MRKKGLTLLEIVMATLILSLVVTGLANLFITSKRYLLHARSRMTGGELGRYFLDPLQGYVRQDQWPSGPNQNCLAAGNCPDATVGTAQGLDKDYTARYTIRPDKPVANINKVSVDITWPPTE
jgi:Tfp pilus assembly protein PilW